jgi:hypothetical protein
MSTSTSTAPRPPHREWHGNHLRWDYRPEAFRWVGDKIVGINFIPLAQDMRAWLQQRGQLPLVPSGSGTNAGDYTNTYTISGASIALILARVVNAYHDFSTESSPADDPVGTEVERLRLYNEIVEFVELQERTQIKSLRSKRTPQVGEPGFVDLGNPALR